MRFNKDSIMNLIEQHMSIEAVAMKTNLKQVHVAVLMKRGKLLGIATNFVGSRNRGCGYDNRTIHAERAVLKKIGDYSKLEGATLVVIRVAKGTGEFANSVPCHSCKCHLDKCIKDYGLRRIYYSP